MILFIWILLFYYCFVGFLWDLIGSYNMFFIIFGFLGVVLLIFIVVLWLCLWKYWEVYYLEIGELEN